MDLFLPIVLFIVFCVMFSICGWCCKRHRAGRIYGFSSNPTVTVTTQPASAVIPPYPIQPGHPQPTAVPIGYGTSTYQTAPYPAHTSPYPPAPGTAYGAPAQAPYPVSGAAPYPTNTTPYPTNTAPYPPANTAPYPSQQPPSYTEAVSQPPAPPLHTTEYTKQSPYNPNY